MLARNNNDAIAVGDNDVSRAHENAAQGDRPLDGFHLVAARSNTPRRPAIVEGHLLLDDLVGIARAAACYHADSSFELPGEDVVGADAAGVAILVGVNDNDGARAEERREGFR